MWRGLAMIVKPGEPVNPSERRILTRNNLQTGTHNDLLYALNQRMRQISQGSEQRFGHSRLTHGAKSPRMLESTSAVRPSTVAGRRDPQPAAHATCRMPPLARRTGPAPCAGPVSLSCARR